MAIRSLLATVKAEETRERILRAALELFRKRGFEKTTMREVAAEAGVATGAAYYYFRSKDELVMAFYQSTAAATHDVLPPRLEKTRDLKKRIRLVIELKLEQFAPHRKFLGALSRTASDPEDPLSPFGAETEPLRRDAVDWMRQAIDGSGQKVPADLAPHLPTLLWLYQMAVIAFWIHDRSPHQRKTTLLLDGTLDLIVKLISLSRLPVLGSTRRKVAQLLSDLEIE